MPKKVKSSKAISSEVEKRLIALGENLRKVKVKKDKFSINSRNDDCARYINIKGNIRAELAILSDVALGGFANKKLASKALEIAVWIAKKLGAKTVYYSVAHSEKFMHEVVEELDFDCIEVGNPNHGNNVFYLYHKKI